jgi:hypothetical protein
VLPAGWFALIPTDAEDTPGLPATSPGYGGHLARNTCLFLGTLDRFSLGLAQI